MPLVIQMESPCAIPTVVCDHCGTVMADAQDGNYQWSNAMLKDDPATVLYGTHRACSEAFAQMRGGRQAWSAIGLECVPSFLARNLHVTWPQSPASARLMMRE